MAADEKAFKSTEALMKSYQSVRRGVFNFLPEVLQVPLEKTVDAKELARREFSRRGWREEGCGEGDYTNV